MLGAGRMTAIARADIGARCSSPTVKRAGDCQVLANMCKPERSWAGIMG
jgi:hypothetical protein